MHIWTSQRRVTDYAHLPVVVLNLNQPLVTTTGTSGAPAAGGLRSKTLSLFNGPYNDLNEGWYRVVGVSLALTMAINVFSPHVSTLTSLLLSRLRRCWDRRCGCDPSITRVATQKVSRNAQHSS